VLTGGTELGVAQWEFGYSTYAFLDDGRIPVIAQRGSRQSLKILEHGRVRQLELLRTAVKPYGQLSSADISRGRRRRAKISHGNRTTQRPR